MRRPAAAAGAFASIGSSIASSIATSIASLAAVVVVTSIAGCVVVAHRGTRAEVSSPPPPPNAEAPLACDPGYARVPGHWRWNGYQYMWIPQQCVYRPGYRWQQGGYVACDDGWCWQEGIWVGVGP